MDVIHARWYRLAAVAYTQGQGWLTHNYDTMEYDDYSLWNGGAWAFFAPVDGFYACTWNAQYAPVGTLNFTGASVLINGTVNLANHGWHQGMSYGVGGTSRVPVRLKAGDYVQFRNNGAGGTAGARTWALARDTYWGCFDYLGSG